MKSAFILAVSAVAADPVSDCKAITYSPGTFTDYCKSMCDHYGTAAGAAWCRDQSSGESIAKCVKSNFTFCDYRTNVAPTEGPVVPPPTAPVVPPVPPTAPVVPPVPPTAPVVPPVPPTAPVVPPVPPTAPVVPPVPPTGGAYTEGLGQAHVNDGQPNIGACQFPDDPRGAKYYEFDYHYQQLDCSKEKPCWSTFRKDHPVVKCGDCVEVVPHLDGVGFSEADRFYLYVVDNNYSHVDFEIDIRAWTPWCPGYCHGSGNCAQGNQHCPGAGDSWAGSGPLVAGFCGHLPSEVCLNGIAATSQKIKWRVVEGCGTW